VTFRCNSGDALQEAILAGAGIGFMAVWEASRHPELVQVMPPQPDWSGALWLVTHVDLHRTNKVQAFLRFLKERAESWCPK
jgi:DNA-binding transcriptional LysR family regulator